MKVSIEPLINDPNIDPESKNTQRQLSLKISAINEGKKIALPLNICLVIDCNVAMAGATVEKIKEATLAIFEKLNPEDRISIVSFNENARVILQNQQVKNIKRIEDIVNSLTPEGNSAIDIGLKLGIKQTAIGKRNSVSEIILITNGENNKSSDYNSIMLAKLAAEYNITINTIGLGDNWNLDILEKIADITGGTIKYIESLGETSNTFQGLLSRFYSVGLTNASLIIELSPGVRLAQLNPIAQVFPETKEFVATPEGNNISIRLGDLMEEQKRVILMNLYIDRLTPRKHKIAVAQVAYEDPTIGSEILYSSINPIEVESKTEYTPSTNSEVQQAILTLAKYRQTQIAYQRIEQKDKDTAVNMLSIAAKTALQLKDSEGANILQSSAVKLQSQNQLSNSDLKRAKIASKTILEARKI